MIIKLVSYEDIEDISAFDFYLMKKKCTCEKEFKTIGIEKGGNAYKVLKEFKQVIPTKNIHPKQMVYLYSED